eukprot:768717-Karenia_brevis.AAC.1
MATHIHDAGLLCIDDFEVRYDERTRAAMTALMADLPPDMHEILRSAVSDAEQQAKNWWDA